MIDLAYLSIETSLILQEFFDPFTWLVKKRVDDCESSRLKSSEDFRQDSESDLIFIGCFITINFLNDRFALVQEALLESFMALELLLPLQVDHFVVLIHQVFMQVGQGVINEPSVILESLLVSEQRE